MQEPIELFKERIRNATGQSTSQTPLLPPVQFGTTLASASIHAWDPRIYDYLRDFFSITERQSPKREIFVLPSSLEFPPIPARINEHGVRYGLHEPTGDIYLQSENWVDLAICARKAIRELHLNRCEKSGYVVLHGSAMYNENLVAVFIGTNGVGKTTLSLDGWLNHGFKLIANDHVVVFREGDSFKVSGLTTFVTLKLAHIAHIFPQLSNRVSLHHSTVERYAEEAKGNSSYPFYFGPQHFGVGEIAAIQIGTSGKQFIVILPDFRLGQLPEVEEASQDVCRSVLTAEIRTEWVYDENANPQFYGFPRRSAEDFQCDSEILCADISKIGRVYRFVHTGSITPLMEFFSCS